jgi:hypothetical protein
LYHQLLPSSFEQEQDRMSGIVFSSSLKGAGVFYLENSIKRDSIIKDVLLVQDFAELLSQKSLG